VAYRCVRESACRRGGERDIDDPRRSLPSKADVKRSAVSVGCAAGRLTGTRGTSKARVEHSVVKSGRDIEGRSRSLHCEVGDDIDGPSRSLPSARSDLFQLSNHLGCPSVAPEGETAERVALGVGLPAWRTERHRGSTSITPIEGSRQTFRSLRRLRRRATDGHPRDVEGSSRSLHREVGEDIEDPRRPLPSKADVQRSAVSVGCAAGRLTGTRGTLKAQVDHSIVRSGRTSRIHVEHFHRRLTSSVPQSPSAAPPGD